VTRRPQRRTRRTPGVELNRSSAQGKTRIHARDAADRPPFRMRNDDRTHRSQPSVSVGRSANGTARTSCRRPARAVRGVRQRSLTIRTVDGRRRDRSWLPFVLTVLLAPPSKKCEGPLRHGSGSPTPAGRGFRPCARDLLMFCGRVDCLLGRQPNSRRNGHELGLRAARGVTASGGLRAQRR
jgi:hypothetical protein